MYGGGMAKLGRGGGGGGGRGGGKRSLPPPPPPGHIQRVGPSAAAPTAARRPVGPASARGRHSVGTVPGGGGVPGAAASEETFRMVSADNLDFAAIIRLTPDLVDEIRRLEDQGGAAKIKFDSNSNNLSGNVIDVGGKEFKFTWSRELGVCDIYEELQNGEDGNGLLSECGSAWRKLNVQRILDESLKNHVKMRSVEAQRQHKARKSIVLDPANPSVKNQAKTMAAAAVEGSMRRMHWKKDQVFKKRKSDPGMAPNTITRSTFKSGLPTNISSGTMLSISPKPSPPEQAVLGASVSPFGMANLARDHETMDEDLAPLTSTGEDAVNSEKELSNKTACGATRRLIGKKGASGAHPTDLRSLLVNLLSDSPKGMSLKALEKAVGEVIPNSGKKIETIIKTIATYQAPGRYILKTGVEMECSRRLPSESGSSPEHPLGSLPVTKVMAKDDNTEDSDHRTPLIAKPLELDVIEKIDIEQNSPDRPTTVRKVDNEDAKGACTSSESGSDSDSDSDSSDSGSDSGSHSRSRSKSQSPMGSGSGSSSDSESDGSSSGKEGSDVDVDIMTSDDEKEETGDKLPISSRLSPSPGVREVYDEKHEENAMVEGNNFQKTSPPMYPHDYVRGNGVCAVKDNEERSKEARIKTSETYEMATKKTDAPDDFQMNFQVLGGNMSSQDKHEQPVLQSITSAGKRTVDRSEHSVSHSSIDKQFTRNSELEQSDGMATMSKSKHKRASESKHIQEKTESSKRQRAANPVAQVPSVKSRKNNFPESLHLTSPDRSETGQRRSQMMLTASNIDQEGSTFDSQKETDTAPCGRHMVHEDADRLRSNPDLQNVNGTISDVQLLGQRAGDTNVRGRVFEGMEKSGRHVDNCRTGRHAEKSYGRPDGLDTSGTRSVSLQGKFLMSKDKQHKDVRDGNIEINEKYLAKILPDDTGGDKLTSFADTHYRRSGDQNGIQTDTKLSLNMHKADVDKCAVTTEKGVTITGEPSDLELGEFREPPSIEDTKEDRKHFERKGSFKSSDSKLNVMDNFSSDSNKGRTPAKGAHELKRESPYVSKFGSQANQDGSYRRMPEGGIAESTIPQERTMSSQIQQYPRTDRPEHDPVSHLDRLSEISGRTDARIGQESHVFGHKRNFASVLPHRDAKHSGHDGHMASKPAVDTKTQKYNGLSNTSDRNKESFHVESIMDSAKRIDSSSDEDDSFYAKYDKNEPELRGPIKDYSQYIEYVQEYREKYDCYSSLDRHLEKFRNEFFKVRRDLEFSKERDDKEAYHNISQQIIQMYLQCKKKHHRMRKIFLVLHDEIKILKQRIKEFVEEYARD